jgi:N-formylglutamate deformylase
MIRQSPPAATDEPAAHPPVYEIHEGNGPLIAAALHDGHFVRPDVAALLKLTRAQRLQEEDPFTGRWIAVGHTRVIGRRSRFELDLNRTRDKAVYLRPEDAWGLDLWKDPPPDDVVRRTLAAYDAFYADMRRLCDRLVRVHGRFVVLDIHSYNHRRGGPDAPPEDPARNPEVNIGTGSMDRDRWGRLVDRFISDLRRFDFLGRSLDVRENVRFQGGHFAKWIHQTWPDAGCAIAIEFRKSFMDEWTGEPDERSIRAIAAALEFAVPGILKELSTNR